jgi:saccharopine dehydrogenase (NADP+, L-glutamate forming)
MLENLVNLLERKLTLKEGETDLVAMQHIFLIETKEGKKKLLKSSLIQIGDRNGYSAMSVTVGTPTAIGTQLILDGKISERGVLIPKYPDIYEPVLAELAK